MLQNLNYSLIYSLYKTDGLEINKISCYIFHFKSSHQVDGHFQKKNKMLTFLQLWKQRKSKNKKHCISFSECLAPKKRRAINKCYTVSGLDESEPSPLISTFR